jgi:hypothetical protein
MSAACADVRLHPRGRRNYQGRGQDRQKPSFVHDCTLRMSRFSGKK